jgi:alpha-tubulin suppressor-like RCC1 family protein
VKFAPPASFSSKLTKLITIAFVSLFLVGCGESGGESGNKNEKNEHQNDVVQPAALCLENPSSNKIVAIAPAVRDTIALDSTGNIYHSGLRFYPYTPSIKGVTIKSIAALSEGDYLALDSEGKVYVPKGNGALIPVTSLKDKTITAIYANYGRTAFAIDSEGKVYAFGYNNEGQLGLSDHGNGLENNVYDVFTLVSSLEGKKIKAIAAGVEHTLALDSEGKVYATGNNAVGQLGLGDSGYKYLDVFTLVPSLAGKKIKAIAAGGGHSLALDSEGRVYATGHNIGSAPQGNNLRD